MHLILLLICANLTIHLSNLTPQLDHLHLDDIYLAKCVLNPILSILVLVRTLDYLLFIAIDFSLEHFYKVVVILHLLHERSLFVHDSIHQYLVFNLYLLLFFEQLLIPLNLRFHCCQGRLFLDATTACF